MLQGQRERITRSMRSNLVSHALALAMVSLLLEKGSTTCSKVNYIEDRAANQGQALRFSTAMQCKEKLSLAGSPTAERRLNGSVPAGHSGVSFLLGRPPRFSL